MTNTDPTATQDRTTDGTAGRPAPRVCLYVDATMETAHGFVPSLVTEGEPGHAPMTGNGSHAAPWYFGTTLADAERNVAAANANLGISEVDALEIVMSSMAASRPAGR